MIREINLYVITSVTNSMDSTGHLRPKNFIKNKSHIALFLRQPLRED